MITKTPDHLPEEYQNNIIITKNKDIYEWITNISGDVIAQNFDSYEAMLLSAWQHYHVGLICSVILGVE